MHVSPSNQHIHSEVSSVSPRQHPKRGSILQEKMVDRFEEMLQLTKKTEVKRRTADMMTEKRKIHASPDCKRSKQHPEMGNQLKSSR